MKIESQVIIRASAQKVWEVFTDESLTGQWISGFKSAKTISGEPLQVGSKHEMTLVERGREVRFLETVTRVVPEKEYGFNLSNDLMTSKNSVTLTPSGNLTTVTQKVTLKGHSLGFRLMMLLMKGTIHKRNRKDLNRLKALVESRP